MQSQQVTTPPVGHSKLLRRVRGSSALQSRAKREAITLITSAVPTSSRISSPRLSHDCTVLNLSSHVLQATIASPALPHPLQVGRSASRAESLVVSPTLPQGDQHTQGESSLIRRQHSRSPHNRKAYVLDGLIYNSELTGNSLPIPRLTNVLSKPPRLYSKTHRSLRSRAKSLTRRLMFHNGSRVVQKPLIISSPINPVLKDTTGGDLKMVRHSALVVEDRLSPFEAAGVAERYEIRAGWEANGVTDPLRSDGLVPQAIRLQSSTVSRLNDANVKIYRLEQKLIAIEEKNASLKEAHQREFAQLKGKFLQVKNQEMERADRFKVKCKDLEAVVRSRVSLQRSSFAQGQVIILKAKIKELEANLIRAQVLVDQQSAAIRHNEMSYEIEKQMRVAKSATRKSGPVMPAERLSWGAEQDTRVGSSQQEIFEETTDYEALSEEWNETAAQQASDAAGTSRVDTMSSTSVEADNPVVASRITDVMLQAGNEIYKYVSENSTFDHRQQFPEFCASRSDDIVSDLSTVSSAEDISELSSSSKALQDFSATKQTGTSWLDGPENDDEYSESGDDNNEADIYQLPSLSASILTLQNPPSPYLSPFAPTISELALINGNYSQHRQYSSRQHEDIFHFEDSRIVAAPTVQPVVRISPISGTVQDMETLDMETLCDENVEDGDEDLLQKLQMWDLWYNSLDDDPRGS
ncbi:uncharacterized protein RAG0_12465 [Rhynchosporium agropyri]|uniref:Uncharacterized protein n=1 Tax=Rhynchosporium agropyri TaxID=914238 RepID=A0A1E1LAY7_9HELO|nr:uncharacterized protein RAG0_12465 [Rhynchosporium agropyri]